MAKLMASATEHRRRSFERTAAPAS